MTASAEERCEKTDMLVSGCSHCNGRRGDEAEVKPEPAGFGPWIASRYPGKCAGCGERWLAGDQIRSDGAGGWLGESCGEGS